MKNKTIERLIIAGAAISILIAFIILMEGCKKEDNTAIPTKICPTGYSGANCDIISPDNFAGNYRCTLTGTLDMTFVSNYPCHTGHRDLNYSFNCTIKSTGNNLMEADSIIGEKINLTLTSLGSFTFDWLIYDPNNCSVPFKVTNPCYSSVTHDTITLTNNGFNSDVNGTTRNSFVLTMIKQ